MEDALLDMAADRDLAWTMFGRCADFAVALARGRLPALPAGLALDRRRRGLADQHDDEPAEPGGS